MHVAVTAPDLALIRRHLATRFPSATPSSLSEAVAAGFGFRTHAAALAHMDSDRSRIEVLPLPVMESDAAACAARIGGDCDEGSRLVRAALEEMGAAYDVAPSEDLEFETMYLGACCKMDAVRRDRVAELSEPSLVPAEKFAYAARLLDWRMGTEGSIVNWFLHYALPLDFGLHRRIAACCAVHADRDPDMARLLIDIMHRVDGIPVFRDADGRASLSGNVGSEDDDALQDAVYARFEWADTVYDAFRLRIRNFLDRMARRWSPADDPWTFPVTWNPPARPARSPRTPIRYPDITVALTPQARGCRFRLTDTGSGRLSAIHARGIAAFAMWRSGVPFGELERFGVEVSDRSVFRPAQVGRGGR